MCGRLTLRAAPSAWIQDFLPQLSPDEMAVFAALDVARPRFNIAPTQTLLCIYEQTDPGSTLRQRVRQWSQFRWGLIPSWTSKVVSRSPLINARSETVDQKTSFRESFNRRRCLIPADGYYEWQTSPDGKQPYLIESSGGGVLAMAGLWAENDSASPGQQPLRSCAILTTRANSATQAIHDRMPVFLSRLQQETWLDPNANAETLMELLRPAADDLLMAQKVSSFVNNVRHDDARCVEPYEPPTQMSLF